MTRVQLVLLLVGVAAVVLLSSSAYTVGETEQVVVTQFGEILPPAVTQPGLHFRVPFIQEVNRFEKRWLEWDGDASQITTRDKRYIYIDTYARWRIANPLLFFERLRDERSADSRLDDILDGATRNVVANHDLIEAIRSTNRPLTEGDEEALASGLTSDDQAKGQGGEAATTAIKVGREKLTRHILEKAKAVLPELGIELVDLQIKRIDYVESVQTKVFERMISERRRVAEAYRSQGLGLASEIRGRKVRELQQIESEAYRKAQEIMGKADAEAAAIYAQAYDQDASLYAFLRTLESYRKTVDGSTSILLGTGGDYLGGLKRIDGGPR